MSKSLSSYKTCEREERVNYLFKKQALKGYGVHVAVSIST
jgi:hypothetical protein